MLRVLPLAAAAAERRRRLLAALARLPAAVLRVLPLSLLPAMARRPPAGSCSCSSAALMTATAAAAQNNGRVRQAAVASRHAASPLPCLGGLAAAQVCVAIAHLEVATALARLQLADFAAGCEVVRKTALLERPTTAVAILHYGLRHITPSVQPKGAEFGCCLSSSLHSFRRSRVILRLVIFASDGCLSGTDEWFALLPALLPAAVQPNMASIGVRDAK